MEQRWEAGRGRDSSCWKQFWLGEGFLIPLLHTGSAAAVNIRRAVPPKAEYPLPRLLLNSSHPCFSMQQDPFCRGWNSNNRRRCQQQSSLPLRITSVSPLQASRLKCGNPLQTLLCEPFGFRWLPFPSLHYVKGAVLCCLSHFGRVQPFGTPWTAACQAPLSMGILQARILEWVTPHPRMPSSRGSSPRRD